METTEDVARKLTRASEKLFYDLATKIEWPATLDASDWTMSPELISLYGTEVWETLGDAQRKKLAFHEVAGFYSLILHGERPLLEGMSHRMYAYEKNLDVLEYMHHFIDEENNHMMMFSGYLRRYVGKVYPEKKIPIARPMAKGEEDAAFYAKVLVIEELSDYYNVVMGQDERLPKITRDVNWTHHVDEARHSLGDATCGVRTTPRRSASTRREAFRGWLVDYINASWRDSTILPSVGCGHP
jgi:hypothetical protein